MGGFEKIGDDYWLMAVFVGGFFVLLKIDDEFENIDDGYWL